MCCHCKKEIVRPEDGPKVIGPYSLGVTTHGLVFLSGQLGLDPASGELVPGGIEAETRQAIGNLNNILKTAGTSLDQVVKTTVFLKNMSDFAPMNTVYAEFFVEDHPARTTIQAGALPKDALVEIDAIAVKPCDCKKSGKPDEEKECNCNCDCRE